jgi:hypothetical protein
VGSLTADCNAIDAMLARVSRELWIFSVGCKSHIWRVGVLSSLRGLTWKRRAQVVEEAEIEFEAQLVSCQEILTKGARCAASASVLCPLHALTTLVHFLQGCPFHSFHYNTHCFTRYIALKFASSPQLWCGSTMCRPLCIPLTNC